MDHAKCLVLTDVALRAARDCPSRKPGKRLKRAMSAVLAADRTIDDETGIMSAVGALLRLVDDRTQEAIQRELYGLGRIATVFGALKEGEAPDEEILAAIDRDMPPYSERLLIMAVWEFCRAEKGLLRGELMMPEDTQSTDPTDPSDDWKNNPK